MNITFRKLGPADASRYRAIRLESLKRHPTVFGSSYEEQRRLPKLMFETALEQPVDERFVIGAFDQINLIGIFGFVPRVAAEHRELEQAGSLIQMYVKPTYRGRKVGLGLVRAVLDEAFKLAGLEQLVLGVKDDNLAAIQVYEQAGFRTYCLQDPQARANTQGFRTMVFRRNALPDQTAT